MLELYIDDDLLTGAAGGQIGGISAGVTGQVQGGGRYLDVIASMEIGDFGAGLLSLPTLRDRIRTRFVSNGWNVGSIDLSFSNNRYSLRMGVWVLNRHSDAEVISRARSGLTGMTSGLAGIALFRNVSVGLQHANVSVGANTGGLTATPNGYSGDPTNGSGSISSGSFLDNFGFGLGVSTPVVLIGGGLLLFLILRR
jgi:hypothetical protein